MHVYIHIYIYVYIYIYIMYVRISMYTRKHTFLDLHCYLIGARTPDKQNTLPLNSPVKPRNKHGPQPHGRNVAKYLSFVARESPF